MEEIEKELQNSSLVEIIKLSEAAEREKQDTSAMIPSGYPDLDGCMDGGFREGDFTIITGVPGEGKSTLARMFTMSFAERNICSLWFSHEMSHRELWDSFQKMGADTSLIAYVPFSLEDDFDWMIRHIERGIAEHQTKAVFIDTLGDVVKSVKDQRELSNYATYLAQMCKDLRKCAIKNKIIIFAVAHAVKNTRSRTNETSNSDIANSNGIPAAATNIFHVWRSEESDMGSYVKIGKSRRDGTKKNWRFEMVFENGRLVSRGRHVSYQGEATWREIK
jgi:KaiC/GvpD/RAD55 family RecA-like ATPase